MGYATSSDIEVRLNKKFNEDEANLCNALLEDSAIIIDGFNKDASEDAKKLVTCRMVIRAIGNSDVDIPIGATQGSMAALGYSQSWTMSSGSTGELYLSKLDKQILGVGNKIGFHSVLEDLTND